MKSENGCRIIQRKKGNEGGVARTGLSEWYVTTAARGEGNSEGSSRGERGSEGSSRGDGNSEGNSRGDGKGQRNVVNERAAHLLHALLALAALLLLLKGLPRLLLLQDLTGVRQGLGLG